MRSAPIHRFEAVALPQVVFEEGGLEVLRAILVKGGLHVSMRRVFKEPSEWGPLLADVLRDIARAYAADRKVSEKETIEAIRIAFAAEMETPLVRAAARKTKTKPKRKPAKRRSRH